MQKISCYKEPRCVTQKIDRYRIWQHLWTRLIWYGFGWPTFICQCVALACTFNLRTIGLFNIRIMQHRTCLLIGRTIQYLSSSKTRTGLFLLHCYFWYCAFHAWVGSRFQLCSCCIATSDIVPTMLELDPSFSYVSVALLLLILASSCRSN